MRRRRVRVALAGLFLISVWSIFYWLFAGLPSPDDLQAYTTAPSSKIYDRYGRLLYEMPPPYTGSHTPVSLDEIPLALRWATIATEDASFYENPGMDMRGIVRSVWINVQGGEVLAGGSTITQQVVRILLFSPEERASRTLRRKLRELALALRVTRRYSKDEILTLYLNETYYGNMAYGVEAAAQSYFGKRVRDLDLAECAMIAGLAQTPALYNPLENMDAAKERQAVVLGLMVKQGYITEDQARLAREERLAFASAPFAIYAPHFVMYVRGLLERELGLDRLAAGGLNIYTTLDLDLNETARDSIRRRLELLAVCYYEPDCPPGGHEVHNAAVVALDPWTGEVLAMVGSPDYFSAEIDGAVNGATALRQPGSALKPFTYAAAFDPATLEQPFTPATMLWDVRTSFTTREGTPYVPLNYDLAFRGPVRLREALASSYNLLAVKVLDTIGIETMTTLTRRLGITTFDDLDRLGLSVTLGGGEVRLLELTAAYAAFANGGRRVQPVSVLRVEDATGAVLWAPEPGLGEQALDERVAYLITDVLSDDLARVPTFGEESVLKLPSAPEGPRQAAVKTGTTTNFRDNWTVGYTPELVVGVWAGNADNRPMREVSGVDGAAPVWRDLMEAALKGRPARPFVRPDGLVDVEVCALSGKLPGPDCPHRVTELFIAGTEPTETCDVHQRVGDQVYIAVPPEAQAWAREHNLPALASLRVVSDPSLSQVDDSTLITDVAALPSPGGATAGFPVGARPSLLLTGPDNGAVYRIDRSVPLASQRIVISAETSEALTGVTLYRRTGDAAPVELAQLSAAPYRITWILEPGDHVFYAVGVDAQGRQVESNAVQIRVQE